jgi:hypothetical protein
MNWGDRPGKTAGLSDKPVDWPVDFDTGPWLPVCMVTAAARRSDKVAPGLDTTDSAEDMPALAAAVLLDKFAAGAASPVVAALFSATTIG